MFSYHLTVFGVSRRRDARLAAVAARAMERGGRMSPLQAPRGTCQCLGEVVGHRQRARRGTKALVRWVADGQTTAAWFWYARPPVGTFVLATGEYSWGAHHDEGVFYVEAGGYEVIPGRAMRAH